MKIAIIFLAALFFSTIADAQFLEPEVHAAAGDQSDHPAFGSLDWTLGEVMVESYEQPVLLLGQGFHQLFELVTGVSHSEVSVSLHLYPNPTARRLFIEMDPPRSLKVALFDLSGRIIQRYVLEGNTSLDLSWLQPGMYLLRFSEGGPFFKSYRIVKL